MKHRAQDTGDETRSGDSELIDTVAALIRDVDGSHTLGAAQLAEALVERGVTMADQTSRVFAAATVDSAGTIVPLSNSFPTQAEAQEDLAVLLGDDYYRDQRPFIATAIPPRWRTVLEQQGR